METTFWRGEEGEMDQKEPPKIAFDLCLLLLDTDPNPLHHHLEHVLKFESGQLFSGYDWFMDEEVGNDEFLPIFPSFSFLPFKLSDSIVSQICSFLDPKSLSALEITSKTWKLATRKGFLADLQKEWLAPVKSRQMLEMLTTALDRSLMRFGYEWKQVWRYLEGIKEEIGIMEAIHEQMIALIGFSHFSLISDSNDPEFDTCQKAISDWVRMASSAIVDTLIKLHSQATSSDLKFHSQSDSSEIHSSSNDSFARPNLNKFDEKMLLSMFQKYDQLLVQWANQFTKTIFATHMKPTMAEYHDILAEKAGISISNLESLQPIQMDTHHDTSRGKIDSFDRSMMIVTELLEMWRKMKSWAIILNSIATPFSSQILADPIAFPSFFGAPLFSPKTAMFNAIKEGIWTPKVKKLVFSVSMALSDDMVQWQQDMNSESSILKVQAVGTAFEELKPFFEIVSEPALSSLITVPQMPHIQLPIKSGNISFKLPSKQFVRLRTIEGSQFRLLVSHAMRFSRISHQIERAIRIGSRFGDDELDEEILLEDCMVMTEEFRVIRLFSDFMDTLPSEYVEESNEDGDGEEEAIKEASQFLSSFLSSPRFFAALLVASRHLGFQFLSKTLQTFLSKKE